jgi:hypothetical protein
MTSVMSLLRRPLCLLVAFQLVILPGCGGTEVNEHKQRGAAECIVFRPTLEQGGEKLHVGGVRCQVREGGAVVAEGTTDGKTSLALEPPSGPGKYEVVITGNGIETVRKEVELKARRRLTIRIDVKAEKVVEKGNLPPQPKPAGSGGPAGNGEAGGGAAEKVAEGALFVLKAVGAVIAVAALVGLVVLVLAVDDDDDCDCRCHRCHDGHHHRECH